MVCSLHYIHDIKMIHESFVCAVCVMSTITCLIRWYSCYNHVYYIIFSQIIWKTVHNMIKSLKYSAYIIVFFFLYIYVLLVEVAWISWEKSSSDQVYDKRYLLLLYLVWHNYSCTCTVEKGIIDIPNTYIHDFSGLVQALQQQIAGLN
jgi:hypothetical protein